MSDFINTSDAIGDELLTAQIIDRTVTEYKDNTVTTVGASAFESCGSLITVDLPEVTSVGTGAFRGSSVVTLNLPKCETIGVNILYGNRGVTKLDFPKVTEIKIYGLQYVWNLTTLILRSKTMCTLGNASMGVSPIGKGTGYIYVPSALLEQYKTATNWSTYANQFRALEDYTVDGTITGELDETKI